MSRKKENTTNTTPIVEERSDKPEQSEGRPQMSDGKKKVTNDDLKPGEKRTLFNVNFAIGYKGTPGKKINGQSMTVPDMSLTVRQLLENHTRLMNGDVSVNKGGYFDFEIPNFNDLTDVDSWKDWLKRETARVNEWIIKDKENAEFERQIQEEERRANNGSNKDLFTESEAKQS